MAGPLPALSGEPKGPPRCHRCGLPLGVYELLHWRRPDGTLVACGWLNARERRDHAHPRSAFFHITCTPEAR